MKDSFGRTIDYMRISITDRCNLRCRYCMPDGTESVPMAEILTYEEIEEVCRTGAGLGIKHLKITGGEPLVRRGCCGLIGRLKEIPGIETVTLTTNGLLLGQYVKELAAVGVDGINISLDTMDRRKYQEITGFDKLDQVLGGMEQAVSMRIPVKINAVSLEGYDWEPLVALAKTYPVDVRFIEMMPIGYGKQFVTLDHQTLKREMDAVYPEMSADEKKHGYGPALYYRIPGYQGSIGLISAVHGKFCRSCNRVRLTSKGFLKSCLCYEDGVDLRAILRDDGVGAKDLEHALRQAVYQKPAAHCFECPGRITEGHNMIDIGG